MTEQVVAQRGSTVAAARWPAPAAAGQPGRASPAGRLLAVNFAACLLLLIQYLLGMAVNLYVTLPGRIRAGASNYFAGLASGLAWVIPDGPAWAAAHAAFGLALVLAAFAGIALTRRQAAAWPPGHQCSARWPSWAPGSTE